MSAYVSIRQHTSAYVSRRQQTSAYVSIRQDPNKPLAESGSCCMLLALGLNGEPGGTTGEGVQACEPTASYTSSLRRHTLAT
jgi:hypothetical protein